MAKNFELPTNVRLNEDPDYVAKLRKVMENNGGYCPCRLQHTEANLCVCEEFRQQIADPEFSGYCHCKFYFKEK